MSIRTDSADTWQHRADRGALLAPRVRPDGTLLVEGYAAREGVLDYRRADGTVRRELVPTATLLDAAKGLARAPVTLEHPAGGMVTPENSGDLLVGDVDGEVAVEDGGFVRVKMAVRRRDAIDAVRAGKQELSPGYRVQLDETPGVHPVHGRYDAIQTKREYNHLAIVDRARGGAEVRLRADEAELVTTIRADAAPSVTTKRGTMHAGLVKLLALLGVTPHADSDDAAIEAAVGAVSARKDAADKATTEAATQRARADAAEAKVATLTAERDAAKAKADAADAELVRLRAADQERKDAAARTELEGVAKALGVDPTKHGKLVELKRAIAAKHLGSDLKADASDAYVDALVDLARGTAAGRKAGSEVWTPQPKTDASDAPRPRVGPSRAAAKRYDDAFQAARGGDQ